MLKPLKLTLVRSTKGYHIYNPDGTTVPNYIPKENFADPEHPPKELVLNQQAA